jgi:hypothetical protein
LPNQIKGFLSKKQLSPELERHGDSPSRNNLHQQSKSYISPSQASLQVGLADVTAPLDDGNPKLRGGLVPG